MNFCEFTVYSSVPKLKREEKILINMDYVMSISEDLEHYGCILRMSINEDLEHYGCIFRAKNASADITVKESYLEVRNMLIKRQDDFADDNYWENN